MRRFEGMANNFRFMVLHVTRQLEGTRQLFERPSEKLLARIDAGDDYIDIQKTLIEKECFAIVRTAAPGDKSTVDLMRSVITITNNLERIADFCANISRMLHHLARPELLARYPHAPFFDAIFEGLNHVIDALFERDTDQALQICRVEGVLNGLYRAQHQQLVADLPGTADAAALVDLLFVFHYLERVGDSLLNIGEAIISAIIGERLKLRQFHALEQTLSHVDAATEVEDVSFQPIWGTRSGQRIGTLLTREQSGGQKVLFKEGQPEKLLEEKEKIEHWHRKMPGLTPQVLDFQQFDGDAALALEYIEGVTLQDLALTGQAGAIDRAMTRLEATLLKIWTATRTPAPLNARYVQQLQRRLPEVFRVHPYLEQPATRIGPLNRPAFSERLEQSGVLDEQLPAPFGVFTHGDLNIDNIIYNAAQDRVFFIDVHRSRQSDYLQDVSVFLVSHFRLPVFGAAARGRLSRLMSRCYDFVRGFARQSGDETVDARLALGLVRSFITSTRFQLNRRFTKSMYQRGTYLLDRLHDHQGRPWQDFKLPLAVLTE
jgi:phosphate uptake regulator